MPLPTNIHCLPSTPATSQNISITTHLHPPPAKWHPPPTNIAEEKLQQSKVKSWEVIINKYYDINKIYSVQFNLFCSITLSCFYLIKMKSNDYDCDCVITVTIESREIVLMTNHILYIKTKSKSCKLNSLLPVACCLTHNTDLLLKWNISKTMRVTIAFITFFERVFNKLSNDIQVDRFCTYGSLVNAA